jgi:hypothetical protein
MTLTELIEKLTDIRDELGDGVDPEVRLAEQPRWAMQHGVANVVAVDLNADDEDDDGDDENARPSAAEPRHVVYIAEGSQSFDDRDDSPYLPGVAAEALGWGRR